MFEISRVGITLFGVMIHWYGVIIAMAVLTAVALCTRREKRYGLPKETSLNAALVLIPAGIIGARLYYILFNLPYYAARPAEIFMIRQGGLAIYGGIITGTISVWIYAKVQGIRFSKMADLIAPALAFAQSMGRWGNFLNMEAYGAEVLTDRYKFFPLAVQIENGSWHWATFFYESVWCLLIAILLLILEKKDFFKQSGDLFLSYVYLYASERFFVEWLRTDSLCFGPIRVSMLVSFLAQYALIILLIRKRKQGCTFLKAFLLMIPVLARVILMYLPAFVCIPAELAGILMAYMLYRTGAKTESGRRI